MGTPKAPPVASGPTKTKPEGQQAAELLRAGVAALAAKDYPTCRRLLTQAYRQQPVPEVLYQLGLLAQAEGRLLEAQDLLKRYLIDPNLEVFADSLEQKEAQRITEEKCPPHGKLSILGDRGTLVFLDDQLVGALPLSRPLLVSDSQHKLVLESAGSAQEDTVQVPVGRLGEVRYTRAGGAVLMSVVPAVLLLDEFSGIAQPAQASLERTIESALQDEHLSIIPTLQALEVARTPGLVECLQKLRCQVQLARESAAEYVLRVRAVQKPAPVGWQFTLELLDTGVGDVAAHGERTCSSCTPAETAAALTTAIGALLVDAQSRPRGTLVVTSTPPGAELHTGDRILGRTPYQGPAWAGALELGFSLQGYDSQSRRVLIFDRRTETLQVELLPEVPEPAPAALLAQPPRWERTRRPRWRLALGGSLLGGGLLLLSGSIAALASPDGCMDASAGQDAGCRQTSGIPGIPLATTGVFLGVTGALLLALPGRFRQVNGGP